MTSMPKNEFDETTANLSREERKRLLIRAEMTDDSGVSQPIVIRNISNSGIGATATELVPAQGRNIVLRIPGAGSVSGTVGWIRGLKFGVELDQALNTRALKEQMTRNVERASPQGKWEVRSLHKVSTPQTDTSRLRKI